MNNYKKITNKIIFIYFIIPIFITAILYKILPSILNYPPDSIDNIFQKQIDGLTYTSQYVLLMVVIISISLIFLKINLKKIEKLLIHTYKLDKKKDHIQITKNIKKILSLCFQTPIIVYVAEILFPLILMPIIFFAIGANIVTIFKISATYVIFFTLASVISFIFTQSQYQHVLEELHKDFGNVIANIQYKTTTLTHKLMMQIFPLICVCSFFILLLSYNNSSSKTSDIYNNIYSKLLNENVDYNYSSFDIAYKDLENINLMEKSHSIFLINTATLNYNTSDNSELSKFFIQYTITKSESQNGRTYDYYCIDLSGSSKKININGIEYFVGIKYPTTSLSGSYTLFILGVTIILIIFLMLLYALSELVSSLRNITSKLTNINKSYSDLNIYHLPIVSNDELGELTVAFNTVQDLTKEHLHTIQNKQDQLVEQERLASLGQMIGGIAHNLKTPIMSISGAAEGINDLINEFDASIGNPVVTEQDFHDIAKDMMEWTTKIKSYTEYMSDVITAVKGQATNLSNEAEISFTITELFKRVNILMKHELKKSVVYLNTSTNIDENTIITGDINSLVQVINNMISNSIQSYNGAPEKEIDLMASKQDNNIVISIKDYGPGLPKVVRDKLFKEMVTTKGKNGTGLGLYMSYSNIKAHFNGTITFDTKTGEGTTFNIIIPM